MDGIVLEMRDLDKQYPGVHALKSLDLELRAGEVHALLGENGAGKSTLMKIIGGEIRADSGSLFLLGAKLPENYNTSIARNFGISMVYQELSLVPSLTVAENIFLGTFSKGSPFSRMKWKETFKQAQKQVDSFGLDIDVRAKVNDLGIASQQLVEILRATIGTPRVLLLDEPTSALSSTEIETLFEKIIKPMKKKGVSIVFISHKLEETFSIADTVTVMRDGEKVGTLAVRDATEDKIISMMVGRRIEKRYVKRKTPIGEVIMSVEGLAKEGLVENCSFHVCSGEIVGFAGLMGAGRTEMAKTLAGIYTPDAGKIMIKGKNVAIKNPKQAIHAGLGYLSENRHEGLVLQLPISPNITLANFREVFRHGILRSGIESGIGGEYIDKFSIEAWGEQQQVKTLSGGNQQKVAIARWVYANTDVFIMDEPTRGIDIGAKVEVYQIMGQLVHEGKAIILISSELPEVMNLSDRIYVMYHGAIVDTLDGDDFDTERIMRSSTGMR